MSVSFLIETVSDYTRANASIEYIIPGTFEAMAEWSKSMLACDFLTHPNHLGQFTYSMVESAGFMLANLDEVGSDPEFDIRQVSDTTYYFNSAIIVSIIRGKRSKIFPAVGCFQVLPSGARQKHLAR